ncbi:MAG: hypothetical protein OXE41_11590 [Gammaproteobacteria bacterium]|nr:hypothetical protein [Gammaproteobacteria bacterium]
MKSDLDHTAITRYMARNGSPFDFSIDNILEPARYDLESRIKDSTWKGGQVFVVDFGNYHWQISGATRFWKQNAYNCMKPRANIFFGQPVQKFDLIILNLLPAWFDFDFLLKQVHSRLNDEGLFAFSSFGPDTLREVVKAWEFDDAYPHVHSFVDKHDLGDSMLRSGLARPIVDSVWMKFAYTHYQILVGDLRAGGFSNIHRERRKSLLGRNTHDRYIRNLMKLVTENNEAVTFEYIYGLGFMQDQSSIKVQPPQL